MTPPAEKGVRESLLRFCVRTGREDLLAQWHEDGNAPLTPDNVAVSSHRKVWWRCDRGHLWQASVAARTWGGTGCPVCAGKVVLPGENDLASLFPHIARQWHREKNGPLTPDNVSPYSNRKVWWLCPQGHPYQAVVSGRTLRGSGCPYCAGKRALPGFNDLATAEPGVAAQWHPTLNAPLTPEMVTAGSRRKIWWICPAGHVWKAAVYSRTGTQHSGCPVCAGKVRQSRRYRYEAAWVERSGGRGGERV